MALFQKQDRSHLIGKQIGSWTVLAIHPVPKKRNWMLLCRCECGVEKPVNGCSLLSGKAFGCKQCFAKHRHKVHSGDTFGKWTVSHAGEKRRGCNGYYCRCDCGHISWVSTSNLVRGTSAQCSACYFNRVAHNKSRAWWRRVVEGAKSRGLELTITYEFAVDLLVRQGERCALSGVPIRLNERKTKQDGLVRRTASLDRIDSSKGYTNDNVQWVHTRVNIMKGAMSDDMFVKICRQVARNFAVKQRSSK